MCNPQTKEKAMRTDVYKRITDRIVSDLEQGVRPWLKPSSTSGAERVSRPLRANGIPYRGINVLVLWGEAMAAGFGSPVWMTFKQALELGGHVRKGQHGSTVVYASTFARNEADAETGEEEERAIPFLKAYTVFNVAQIEGLPERFAVKPEPRLDPIRRIARADAFVKAADASIRPDSVIAYYSQKHDEVQMPAFGRFTDAESYYATLAHELTHWTGHPCRLAREFGRKRWGDEGYAMEELVAELGAAFLSADLDLTPEPRADHAAYVASWLKVLKNDTRAIFSAAADAQRAADFLHGLQPKAEAMVQQEDAA